MLTLAQANTIAQEAIDFANSHHLAPLTVVVLDAGGHPIVVQRQDRSAFLRVEIATGKAWGSLGLGFNSRTIGRSAVNLPAFFGALATASGGRLIPAAGGVLITEGTDIVGAIGVSGDSSDADEACAIAGVRNSGFVPDPPEASAGFRD